MNHQELLRRDLTAGFGRDRLCHPSPRTDAMGSVYGWAANQYAIVIGWIPLRFHEPLTTAVRATAEIRVLWRSPIEGANDCPSRASGFVDGPIVVIDSLFAMSSGE